MKNLNFIFGALLIGLGLFSAFFLVTWSWAAPVSPRGVFAKMDFAWRFVAIALPTLSFFLSGFALLRLGSVRVILSRIDQRHKLARKKLEWNHVFRALLVGDPDSSLLKVMELAPAVAELILDGAFIGKRQREIYSDASQFIQLQATRGPLDAPPFPVLPAELLSAAIREACEKIYPR